VGWGFTTASIGVLGVPGMVAAAQAAEELGATSLWTAEATGTESFAMLGAIGAATRTAALGTGVLAMQLRTPPLAAMAAATLQALHPDREVLLGVGVSAPAVATRWHGATMSDRPLAHVREYVALVRACLSGERVDHDGDHYRIKGFQLGIRLGERKPKIVLAALGPQMLRLAGDIADGVLLNYIPAAAVPWSVEQVRAGGDARIYAYVHACVGDREASALSARRDLFGYATAPGYRRQFERAGYHDEMTDLHERMAAGDRDGAVGAISDRMIDEVNTVGDADHVAAFTRAYVEAGVEEPVLMPLPWGKDRAGVVRATTEAFAAGIAAAGPGTSGRTS
jgi:probable F420-dependent oxidoreductase